MIYIIAISFSLIILAFYLILNTKSSPATIIIFSIFLLVSFSLHVLYGVSYYFTGEGVNAAVLYHINYGLAGASFIEYWKIVLSTIIAYIFIFLLLIYIFNHNKKSRFNKKIIYFSFILIIFSMIINPATFDLYKVRLRKPLVLVLGDE